MSTKSLACAQYTAVTHKNTAVAHKNTAVTHGYDTAMTTAMDGRRRTVSQVAGAMDLSPALRLYLRLYRGRPSPPQHAADELLRFAAPLPRCGIRARAARASSRAARPLVPWSRAPCRRHQPPRAVSARDSAVARLCAIRPAAPRLGGDRAAARLRLRTDGPARGPAKRPRQTGRTRHPCAHV